MRNAFVIFRKEIHGYFTSPVAYILLAMFAVIFGLFFWSALGAFVFYAMEAQMRGQSFPMDLNEQLIRPLLSNINVIMLFFIPLITMRLFAEEKRSGTIELLVTSPIHDLEIIAGKWLAAMALYGCMLLVTLLNLAFLFKYGQPDWKPVAIAYVGMILQAAGMLAIGMFISTLTKNQIIAAAATFGVCLVLWVMGWPGSYENATWTQVLSYMSVTTHMEPFSKGLLDTRDTLYYLSLIFVGFFLTARSLESLRWRS
jgi:ABC-2 type transport system permease protein